MKYSNSSNLDRAERALRAVNEYKGRRRIGDSLEPEDVRDLIGDLLHLYAEKFAAEEAEDPDGLFSEIEDAVSAATDNWRAEAFCLVCGNVLTEDDDDTANADELDNCCATCAPQEVE